MNIISVEFFLTGLKSVRAKTANLLGKDLLIILYIYTLYFFFKNKENVSFFTYIVEYLFLGVDEGYITIINDKSGMISSISVCN